MIRNMLGKFHVWMSALLTATALCAFAAEEPVVVDAKAFLHHGAGGGRVSLRGIVVDAFKDTIDDDYVFMVLNCGGNFVYAFIQSDDTAQTLRDLQPFIGRSVVASGKAKEVPSYDRVMTPQATRCRSRVEHTAC